MAVLTNGGNGTFDLAYTNTFPIIWPGFGCAVDVNLDGKLDILIPNYASGGGTNFLVYTNNGTGILGHHATFPIATGPFGLIRADMNGDGLVDLVSPNLSRRVSVLTNSGNGEFAVAFVPTTVGISGSGVTADVNGDGRLDIVTANKTGNSISVYINMSSFGPPASVPMLTIQQLRDKLSVSWPSPSPGWLLQRCSEFTTGDWSPGGFEGYEVNDDGTNKSLVVSPTGNKQLFFRLMHP